MSKSKFDAKSLMAWAKSRWSLVFFAVVALLLLPAMVYFAMGLAASKHAAFEKQVAEDAKDFNSTAVKYNVPPMLSTDPPIETSHAPNEALTQAFKAARDVQQAAAAGLVTEAKKHNQGEGELEHKQLVDKVFPDKAGDVLAAKQFRRVYVNEATKSLLAMINAKEPISTTTLAQVLSESERNFLQRELGSDANGPGGGRDKLPQDKARTLDEEMVKLRVRQYKLWGEKLSVYAGMEIFPDLPPLAEAVIPTPVELWDWQVRYWTMQDVMRAVAQVNAPARDQGVSKSVVKRIERIAVDPDPALSGAGSAPTDPNAPLPPPPAAGGTDATGDYKSITGHKSNGLYDVRTVNMVCVVATRDLPKFFDALGESNLMTVTRVRVSKVDQIADLRNGFYYGDDHVTRVDIGIEALWLREWTKDLMPKEVKIALGLEAADPGAAPAPGATPPGGAPPPPPSGRRAGGAAGG